MFLIIAYFVGWVVNFMWLLVCGKCGIIVV